MSVVSVVVVVICAGHGVHKSFFAEFCGELIVFHLIMDSKTFLNVFLSDLCKPSLNLRVKTCENIIAG